MLASVVVQRKRGSFFFVLNFAQRTSSAQYQCRFLAKTHNQFQAQMGQMDTAQLNIVYARCRIALVHARSTRIFLLVCADPTVAPLKPTNPSRPTSARSHATITVNFCPFLAHTSGRRAKPLHSKHDGKGARSVRIVVGWESDHPEHNLTIHDMEPKQSDDLRAQTTSGM